MPTKIFIGNLAQSSDEGELRALFEKHGRVGECSILGSYGFAHMDTEEEAMNAINELNHKFFNGSKINVELSKSRPRRDGGAGGRGGRGGGGRGRGGRGGGGAVGNGGGAMRGAPRGYERPSPYSRDRDRMGDEMYDRRDRGYPEDYRRPPYGDLYRDRYADAYPRRSPPPDPYDSYRRPPYERDPYYRDRYAPDPYERDVGRDRALARPPPEYYSRRERADDMRSFPREYATRDGRAPPREATAYGGRGEGGRAVGVVAEKGYPSSRDYPSASSGGGGGGAYATSGGRNGYGASTQASYAARSSY